MNSDEQFRADFGLSGVKREVPTYPGFQPWTGGPITAPGAYRGVPNDQYHGNGLFLGRELCGSPSVSSTALKVLASEKGARKKGQTPRQYWEGSNLNPAKKARKESDALRLGRAYHDGLLLPDVYDSAYHILPPGFSRAASVKQAAQIAEADAAIAAGMTCLTEAECLMVNALVDATRADPLIEPFLHQGEAEVTLAWQDHETGIWLRARPDWMLPDYSVGMNFKTDADASWSGFSASIAKFGYAQSAALELDGYQAVFGIAPTTYLHPVVEKPSKDAGWEDGDYIATALWELPEEDIDRGRYLNRMAIRTFAECLATKRWPGYTPEQELCGLPSYARHVIDNGGAAEPADDEINGG